MIFYIYKIGLGKIFSCRIACTERTEFKAFLQYGFYFTYFMSVHVFFYHHILTPSHTILKQIIILLISETPSATACTPPLFIKVSYLGQITSNSWISNYFELLSIIYLSIGSNSFLNYIFFQVLCWCGTVYNFLISHFYLFMFSHDLLTK